jgi:hypothetical protein
MPQLENLEELLSNFKKLPKINTPNPTIIEIAGFPHYENVCSNILAYYFDTTINHGLKNLLIKSLLENVDEQLAKQTLETIEVNREVTTHTNKRIDILIKAEDVVIAIENKIYANLYNDLNDYADYIEKNYFSSFKKIKIVLSLHKVPSNKLIRGFANVVYSDFIKSIRNNIGEFMLDGESKSLLFLLDFLTTMQNLTKPQTMDPEIIKFFNDNNNSISYLMEEKNKLNHFIANKVNQLKELIRPLSTNASQWTYQKYTLVYDFTINETVVAVDTNFDVDGIEICVWIRKGDLRYYEYLPKLLYFQDNPISLFSNIEKGVYVIEKKSYPLLTPLDIVAEKLNEVLKGIVLTQEENRSI